MARYTAQMIARAREHHAAGWSLAEIARHLDGEFGCRPGRSTVHAWVNPEAVEGYRSRYLPKGRALRVARDPSTPRVCTTPERALERMVRMRKAGLSMHAIAVVAGLWWGQELTGDQVRSRLEGRREYRKRGAARLYTPEQ